LLFRPRVGDDNDGKAVSARVQRRWGAGLTLGLSAARAAYLARAAAGTQADRQRAFALDAEFARGPWVLRAELMRSDWDAPTVQARALRAWVGSVEMRLRLTPRLDLGARAERLAFARVTGASLSGTWDADVERCEAVLAFRAHPRAQLKAGWQQNWRDGGYVRSEGLALAQFGVRF
jgi:hypothetical protein